MHSDQQFHGGRPRAHARAVVMECENGAILLRITYALAAAIITVWLTHLSSVTDIVLNKANALPEQLSYNEMVNRAHKTDQLTVAPFNDRWNAPATSRNPDAARRTGRIPDGCEPAFGGLVKVGNFSSRCVT
jgi:hypothetical protein